MIVCPAPAPAVEEALGPDWSLIISALSLAVAAVLAVREFIARPRAMAWYDKLMVGEKYVGYLVNIGNSGRAPLVISAVGRATEAGSLQLSLGQQSIAGKDYENPEMTTWLLPGEQITIAFPADHHPEDSRFEAQMLQHAWKSVFVRDAPLRSVIIPVRKSPPLR